MIRRVKYVTVNTITKSGCLTGAQATASSGVLLPSTRAFGPVPLAGEVDKPKRKERAPVVPEAGINEQFVDQKSGCGIIKILIEEGECRRLGEIWSDETPLCRPHAELVRFRKRGNSLLEKVFEMDRWLDSTDGEADELRVRRVKQQRNELVEELRFNHTQIGLIHDELLKD